MQEDEADAVRDAIEKLANKAYPLISIHDAIVTTDDGVKDVKKSILDTFAKASIIPPLKEMKLSV